MNNTVSLVRNKHALLFDVPAFFDESLTSWLIRTSIAHGMTPLMLTDYYWGYEQRLWTRYLDLGFPLPGMQNDIEWLSKDKSPITFATLLDDLPQKPNMKLGYFINHQAKRNRRTEHGSSYCPICFEEKTPYLKLEWQLATALYCSKHGCRLQQKCPACGALYSPQLLEAHQNINQCHHCSAKLHGFTVDKLDVSNAACQSIHKDLVNALFHKKSVHVLGCGVSPHEYIDLLILLTMLVRYGIRNQNQKVFRLIKKLGIPVNYMESPNFKGLSFPLLTHEERLMMLNVVHGLLQTNLKDLIDSMIFCGFNKETVLNEKGIIAPNMLEPLIAALPADGRKKRKVTSTHNAPSTYNQVARRWLLLQRRAQQKSI